MSNVNLKRKNTTQLRRVAEKEGIVGWDSLERSELVTKLQKKFISKERKAVKKPAKKEEEQLPGTEESLVKEEKGSEDKGVNKFTVIGLGVEEGHIPIGSKEEIMKKCLEAQTKVRLIIPLEQGESYGATHPVIINGYRLNIKKGMYVDVPEQVAEMIEESQRQTQRAIDNVLKLGTKQGTHPELGI